MEDELNRIRRHELKYLITEEQGAAIREYIRPFFSLDRHASPELGGYTVNNLYLDTPDLRFYWDVKHKKLRRFKPRIRFYGDRLEDSLWLELKNRHGHTVWKRRRRVPASEWPGILDQTPAEPPVLSNAVLPRTFEDAFQLLGCEPVLHVRYFREPWVSDIDAYGRVTFDRRLRCRLAHGSTKIREVQGSDLIYYDDPVTMRASDALLLLEVKVEQQVPQWATALVRRFDLDWRGFSKYCYAIDRCLEATGSRSVSRAPISEAASALRSKG